MDTSKTAQSYNEIADFWSSEKFNSLKNGIAQYRRAIQFTPKRGKAIDIGCGSSGRLIDLFIQEGFEAEGLDISPVMVEKAKLKHPDVKFHLADIVSWDSEERYSFISAWDSVWHVPLHLQEQTTVKLLSLLDVEGVLIFTTGGVDEAGDGKNDFLGQPLYHAALGVNNLLSVIIENGGNIRHLEYDQYPELHTYVIAQKA